MTFEAGGVTSFDGITLTLDAQPVPEPSTFDLLGIGVASLLGLGWRRRRA